MLILKSVTCTLLYIEAGRHNNLTMIVRLRLPPGKLTRGFGLRRTPVPTHLCFGDPIPGRPRTLGFPLCIVTFDTGRAYYTQTWM